MERDDYQSMLDYVRRIASVDPDSIADSELGLVLEAWIDEAKRISGR